MEPFASGVETITPPFERQAWMPPPPPHEPVPRELAEVAGAGASDSESVPAMMPVSLDPEMPPAVRGSRRWTTIAWTIAIVSPFMVVAGFLIGYAVATGMFGK
jgi:hypothetical protein